MDIHNRSLLAFDMFFNFVKKLIPWLIVAAYLINETHNCASFNI